MMRCVLADEPGALAELAGAIGAAGGDIQAVDVVEHVADAHGRTRAVDDLLVVVDADRGAALLDRVRAMSDIELVHAGPSRGHPGDAVTRLAVMLEALLTGQSESERGLTQLLGGQVGASSARLHSRGTAPDAHGRRLVLGIDHRVVVLERDYRFTATEQERVEALLRLCLLIAKPEDGT